MGKDPSQGYVSEDIEMELDTTILLVLTACALIWFVIIYVGEDRRRVKELRMQQQKERARTERIRSLDGRR